MKKATFNCDCNAVAPAIQGMGSGEADGAVDVESGKSRGKASGAVPELPTYIIVDCVMPRFVPSAKARPS